MPAEQLWFLDTLVTIHVAHGDGPDGVSVIESRAQRNDSPPLHIHHTEDEIFHVLEGSLRIRLDGRDVHVGTGEWLLAPQGVAHTYCVESDEARFLTLTRNGQFEGLVRDLGRPAERPELPEPAGPPSPAAQAALAAAAARHSIELLGPPLA